MSLFDVDDLALAQSIVTEGKECDEEKECKDCEDEDEKDTKKKGKDEDDDDEDEVDEDDAEEAEESARFDVEEAASFDEMKGYKLALHTMVEESHAACLEFIGTTIAMDKVDVKCTESLVKATTDAEKEIVTEQFKESLKVYFQKFKALSQKVMGTVVRAKSRAIAYFKQLIAKLRVKVSRIKSIDAAKAKETDITVAKGLTKDYSSKLKTVIDYLTKRADALADIATKATDVETITAKMQDVEEKGAAALEKAKKDLYGEEVTVKVSALGDVLGAVKNADVASVIKMADGIATNIKEVEQSVYKANDVDSKVMAAKVAMINKIVKCVNAAYSLIMQFMTRWLQVRVRACLMCGVKTAAPAEGATESMSLLEQFEAMC